MALRPILTAPDPRLKKKSKAVERVDDDIRQLMDDMLETMYAAPGIGLAAPQVGVLKRVIVLDIDREDVKTGPICMANPEIVEASDEDASYEEGCLSLPEHYSDVVRPASVKVRYLDRDGKQQEMVCDGLLSTCVQHEIDHLDGILFVDHISALKRNMILRKLLKTRKEQERDEADGRAPSPVLLSLPAPSRSDQMPQSHVFFSRRAVRLVLAAALAVGGLLFAQGASAQADKHGASFATTVVNSLMRMASPIFMPAIRFPPGPANMTIAVSVDTANCANFFSSSGSSSPYTRMKVGSPRALPGSIVI